MRVLADQDVSQVTVQFFRRLGHDVVRVRDVGVSAAADSALLDYTRRDNRVVLTRDKGFAAVAFLDRQRHPGIILLRIDPRTLEAVHEECRRFLGEHPAMDMAGQVVVVEPGRHRIRSTIGRA